MRKIDRLKNEARIACAIRGHRMSKFDTMAPGNCIAHCVRCDKEVQVLANPKPNEIDIGGSALAYGCEEVA